MNNHLKKKVKIDCQHYENNSGVKCKHNNFKELQRKLNYIKSCLITMHTYYKKLICIKEKMNQMSKLKIKSALHMH